MDPTFLCKSEIFQGGMKINIIGANIDKGIFFIITLFLDILNSSLQSLTGSLQSENRVFPVKFSHTGKNLFSLQGSQVMETGFFLLGKVHRETTVFITGMGLQ